jgi:enoyl-CoA hydratase/carnithine racemase
MEGLESEIIDGVQSIRFDRVENQNALTTEVCEAVADALSFGESSSRVRAFLITGGPGLFSVGHDIDELSEFASSGTMGSGVVRLFKTIATVDKPIVAAVDGVAIGAAATLLLHCDYVIASEWTSISAPYVDRGLAPEGGASLIAPAIMGYQRAFGMLVMGDTFDAHQAQSAGLVNKVVPAEDVEAAGRTAAAALAAKPPEAVRSTRRLMRGEANKLVAQIDREAITCADLLRSPAALDALRMFIEQSRKSNGGT